jgi:peptidyl-prolyl cis-trans isomerase A (cyclophilin A)
MAVRSILSTTLSACVFAGALQADVAITIETEKGTIDAVLYDTKAPVTVANFLRYMDAHRYDGGRFHRTVRTRPDNQPNNTVKIDVIQASAVEAAPGNDQPIPLERTRDTGLSHLDGGLSMARDGPDTATSDFFICIGDQPSLDFAGKRNPDGQGFAIFGRVTGGMDVVHKIHESPTGGTQALTPPLRILRIRRR